MQKTPTIQSSRNGLVIGIQPQAKGLLGRFATKGDNELVFVKPKGVRPADAKNGENSSVAKLDSPVMSSVKAADLA